VDTVVPLDHDQAAHLEAAELLLDTWFPDGTEFTRGAVGIQYSVMSQMRAALADAEKGPKLWAAINTLGCKPIIDHLLKHIDVYAKKLGLAGKGDKEPTATAASEAWHQTYTLYAISVLNAYADDRETQDVLLGNYQKQLDEHRKDMSKARKRAKKAQADAQKKALLAEGKQDKKDAEPDKGNA
jgi:hypothetical protein